MPLDNVIFPEPFKLSSRDARSVTNFRVAVFETARRCLHRLPPKTFPAETVLMRNVPGEYGKTGEQARTVPPNSSNKTTVRWSGLIEKTSISRGALYTSLDTSGLLNEAMRYRRDQVTKSIPWTGAAGGEAKYTVFGPTSKDYRQLLVGRVYYTFKLKEAITVLDLTPSAGGGFYDAIENDRQYQAAKRDLRVQPELWRIAFDPVDYTASRPLGLSVLIGFSGNGLHVPSAQDELPDTESRGVNLVLGGDDGKPINVLEPIGKLIAGVSGGRQALIEVKLDPRNIDRTIVNPGSVLPTSRD